MILVQEGIKSGGAGYQPTNDACPRALLWPNLWLQLEAGGDSYWIVKETEYTASGFPSSNSYPILMMLVISAA